MKKSISFSLIFLICIMGVNAATIEVRCGDLASGIDADGIITCPAFNQIYVSFYVAGVDASDNMNSVAASIDINAAKLSYASSGKYLTGDFMESNGASAQVTGIEDSSGNVDTIDFIAGTPNPSVTPTGGGYCGQHTLSCTSGTVIDCTGADISLLDTRDLATTETLWVDTDGKSHLFEEALVCIDNDDDGYGVCPNCGTSTGCDYDGDDCDDTDAGINPGATEVCNGIDDNCVDGIDETGNALCDDGAYCNGQETCAGVSGCQEGDDVACESTVSCVIGSCNEGTDSCDFTPDDDLCDDGAYCNGVETCDAVNNCQPGKDVDCSGNDLTAISTCDNIPDNNPFTWDYRAAFISSCNEATDKCTTGDNTITHECSTQDCSAECESDGDCTETDCDYLDGCQGNDYHDYDDVVNTCLEGCTCTENQCGQPKIYTNDPRCTPCQVDDDCNGLDKDYCEDSLVKHDEGKCVNYECIVQTTTTEDCDLLDKSFCSGTQIIHEDYTCRYAACELGEVGGIECDDEEYCNGEETCENAQCVEGTPVECDDSVGCTDDSCNENTDSCDYTPNNNNCDNGLWCDGFETCDAINGCQSGKDVDCSGNDLTAISTCDNIPDNNPFTWDYRAAFISSCDEVNDKCETGGDTINHECDIGDCNADCEENEDCDSNTCSETYNDYCEGKKLAEYDNDKIKDSTMVEDSCENSCENDCTCTDCTPDCSAPTANIYCVKDICDAECAIDGDCDDGERLTIDTCLNSCVCQHQRVDCIRNEDCDDKNICTDEVCNLGTYTCEYTTNNNECDDGLYCTVSDVCSDGDCSGTTRDCSANDLIGIATCTNDPDDNSFTWDSRDAFTSTCNEQLDECTTGDDTIIHTPDIQRCGAECEIDEDCICPEDTCTDSDNDALIDDYNDYPSQGTCDIGSCIGCQPGVLEHNEECLTAMKVQIEKGVSMFSLPLVPASDTRFNDIQDGCTFTSGYEDVGIAYWDPFKDEYEYIDGYNVLYSGQGYFTTQEEDCDFIIEGYKFTAEHLGYLGSGNIYLGTGKYKGWNMIGAPSEPVNDFDLVEGNCPITSGPWGFDADNYKFVRTQTLEPGRGYFIKTTNDCELG